MNAVVYYSNTGQSRSVAEYFSAQLGYPLMDLNEGFTKSYQNLVLVFPVHCQNVPAAVKAFLKQITVKNLTAIATYGKMCCGNVLYEIQNKYQKNIVAGGYIPTKHSYVVGDGEFKELDKLEPIVKKVQDPGLIILPKLYKNVFADFFPRLRSRLGVKINRASNCSGCNRCGEQCIFGAIKQGRTNKNCIRCLKCVEACPNKALSIKLSPPLKAYLQKKKNNRVIIYV